MSNKCFIFGALDVEKLPITPQIDDFVIAADKGLLNCLRFNINCDMIIGDFDSLGYTPISDNVTVLPTHKNDTDIGYAINKAISMGFKEFCIFGAVGKREDMTFANVQLVSSLSKNGCFAVLFGKEQSVTAITNSSISFSNKARGRISVFSITENSFGVYEKGLEYTLENATLSSFYPLGVSNSFVNLESEISVREGTLAVFFEGNDIPKLK